MTPSAQRESGRPVEVLVEVHPRSVSGDLAPRPAVPEEFRKRAAEIADGVAEVAAEFRSRLGNVLTYPADANWGVQSIEIGFDIAVQAEAGIVIAKATTGATFSARLTLKVASDQQ